MRSGAPDGPYGREFGILAVLAVGVLLVRCLARTLVESHAPTIHPPGGPGGLPARFQSYERQSGSHMPAA